MVPFKARRLTGRFSFISSIFRAIGIQP